MAVGTCGRMVKYTLRLAIRHCAQSIVTRKMAIANGTCVNICNQPKAHYLATSRESRRYVVAGASIWLRQESLRHILASPGYAPVTIAKVRHFNTFFAHFGFPWVRFWDNRGKCYMDRNRIQ